MNIKIVLLLTISFYGGIFAMENINFKQPLNEQEDIYPMPIFCTLSVNSVQESLDWYSKSLDFRSIFSMHDPVTQELTFVHLRRHKYQDILLVQGQSNKQDNAGGIAITFQAWTDIDALTDRAKNNGAKIIKEPHDTLWNTRDVTFEDNDGYNITFTYPTQKMIEIITAADPEQLERESWEK